MTIKEKLTDEDLDFFQEMMNIGAGNAAGALSQLLNCRVEMKMPNLNCTPDFGHSA